MYATDISVTITSYLKQNNVGYTTLATSSRTARHCKHNGIAFSKLQCYFCHHHSSCDAEELN